MNCRAVQERLSAYLDRELTGDELLRFRDHLSQCPICRTEEQEVRKLKALLGTLPVAQPRAELADQLCDLVLRENRHEGRWSLGRSLVAFAGVAVVSMAITFFFLSVHGRGPKAMPKDTNMALDIAQDQSYDFVSDPGAGAPVLPVSNYYGRR